VDLGKLALSNTLLIVFTRYPIAGQAKTRLIPAIGAEAAAQLQRRMTERTITIAKSCDVPLQIQFCGGTIGQMQDWLGADLIYQPQSEGDLGDRMAQAFAAGFAAGEERVVIIGTDCPGIDRDLIHTAFTALESVQSVFGVAEDGGYYLIGLNQPTPSLFQDIPWSSETVLSDTLAIADAEGISYELLKELPDIDRAEDLRHLPAALQM
jgi:rSAM/selenodomain-associated transferase 1